MPINSKLEVHNASLGIKSINLDSDDKGTIPDNLANLTMTVIGLHRANGDLAWLADMTAEAEIETQLQSDLGPSGAD